MKVDNISKFMSLSENHITNINRALKNIKLEILADFVCNNHHDLIIITNKVTLQSDLTTIKNYIKNVNTIKSEDIIALCLSQSKSYLKIIDIPYIREGTNSPINFSNVESIIQLIHIFNNVFSIKTIHHQDITQI